MCSRPSRLLPAASSTKPAVCSCSIPSCSARWRSGARSPANTRPSASRIRQRSPPRWLLARSGTRAAVAVVITSSVLRYGLGRLPPRSLLRVLEVRQVVAGDRLGLWAVVIGALERVDHARPPGGGVSVEHLPAGARLSHEHLVGGAVGVVVAPDW